MISVLLVTTWLAIWGQKQTQTLVAHSGVHVEAAALALAAGPHPTCILGPPQQCLPHLLHSCLQTQQLRIKEDLLSGNIDKPLLQWQSA